MFKLLALSAAGVALANPIALAPRQFNATSMMTTSMSSSQTGAASSTVTAGTDSSSAVSALSSVASSASGNTTMAPAPTGLPSNNGTNSNSTNSSSYAYGCPTGYSVTYVLGISTYPAVNISTAYNALFNWNIALPQPFMPINASGSGPGQAMRSYMIQNVTVTEQLVNQTDNATAGFLDQSWVTLNAVNVSSSLVIANATSELTLFSNSTTNATTVQFYTNFCASSQQAGLAFYSQVVSAYLTGLNGLFLNSTSSGNMTSSANMTMSSVSSSVSSSATSVASSLSSGATGVAGTVTSGAVGAGSTAVSAVSGAASTGISGANSVISAGASGASSVGSLIASVFTGRARL